MFESFSQTARVDQTTHSLPYKIVHMKFTKILVQTLTEVTLQTTTAIGGTQRYSERLLVVNAHKSSAVSKDTSMCLSYRGPGKSCLQSNCVTALAWVVIPHSRLG